MNNWIDEILRRNCIIKYVIEGKIDGGIHITRRRGRGSKQLLNYFKEKRGYCKFKEEALYCTL
jgi:hypothetical protein